MQRRGHSLGTFRHHKANPKGVPGVPWGPGPWDPWGPGPWDPWGLGPWDPWGPGPWGPWGPGPWGPWGPGPWGPGAPEGAPMTIQEYHAVDYTRIPRR